MKSIPKFSGDSADGFSFNEINMNNIIFIVSNHAHRLLYCVFIEVDFEK